MTAVRNRISRRTIVVVIVIVIAVATATIAYFEFRTDRRIPRIDGDTEQEMSEFLALAEASQLSIAAEDEPGERLWLCVHVIDKSAGRPLAGKQVHFYQASLAGEYEPADPKDESTARLSGSALTDSQGRILLDTVLPGDYGSSTDNRHIHTTVPDAKPVAYDIHFRQYSTYMLRRFIAGSRQHFLVDLQQDSDGRLIGFVTIEARFEPPSPESD